MNLSQAWGIIAAAFIIIMPLVYEGWDIHKAMRNSSRDSYNTPDGVAYDLSSNNRECMDGRQASASNGVELESDLKNNIKDNDNTAVYVL